MIGMLLLAAGAAAPPPVSAVVYDSAGMLLAGTRGVVHRFEVKSYEPLDDLSGQLGRVTALAANKEGWLAVASGEPGKSGLLRLYPGPNDELAADWVARRHLIWTAHKDAVYGLAFAPDGKTLATAGYDRTIKLWDVPPKPEPRLTLTDHSDAVYSLAFHPDGKLLASGAADRAVKVWDVATGKRLYTLSDPTDWVHAVAWSPDGKRLAAGGADKSVRVWEADAAGGKLVLSAFAHHRAVTRLAFAGPDVLFTVGEDRVVKTWDAKKLTEKFVLPPQPDAVLSFVVSPKGDRLAVGRYDGVLAVFDAATGKVVAEPLPIKPKPPNAGKLTPDAVPRGKTVRVVVEGTNLQAVTAAACDRAGVTVAVVGEGRSPTRLPLDLTASPSTAVGAAKLTLKSPAGDAGPLRVWVDRFPAVAEKGSTDSAHDGMLVTLPATLVGGLDRTGDTDFFRFDGTAGQEVGAELTTAAERTAFDPVLVVTDDAGRVVADGADSRLGFVVPRAGRYAVAVRDREFRGGPDLGYRLHVGPVPVVTGVFPLGVTRGKETIVRVLGVNLGQPGGLTVTVPADTVGPTAVVPVPRSGGDPVGKAGVQVGEFPAVTVAPDGTAALPALPATADGLLAKPGEAHAVRFPAKKGERLVIETHAARLGSPADTTIEVLDAAGKPVPRATLRCAAKVHLALRDRDSESPGLRLDVWNELAIDDYLFARGELMRIKALPRGPDDDAQFYAVAGKRVGFLGTTPTYHAFADPLYKVELHPPGATFPPNGMPVFPVFYRNDDGGPPHGKDSALMFDPPADGEYAVRVTDGTGAGGPTHAYRLTVRPPRPDFALAVSPVAPKPWAGGAVPLTITATRTDGFDGPIALRLDGVVPPFRVPETVIEAGQLTAVVAFAADERAVPKAVPSLKVVGRAMIAGREVVHDANAGVPGVAAKPDIATSVNLSELVIRPGSEARMVVTVDRRNGFAGRVPLDVRGLPHGVRVLNVGLSGILVLPHDSKREVVVYAEPWVKPQAVPFVVLARNEKTKAEFAAPSVLLVVK